MSLDLDADLDVDADADLDVDLDVDLAARAFDDRGGADRDDAFMRLERRIRTLCARRAQIARRVEVSHTFLDDGHHSAASWLSAVTNTSSAAARQQIRIGRLLEDCPEIGNAARRGELGDEQLRLLANLHGNDRCRPQMPAWQGFLTSAASSFALRDFRHICQRWQLAADPDGTHRDHVMSREHRKVTTTSIGTGHILRAEGDAYTGEIIASVLDAFTQIEWDADVAQRAALHGEAASQHPLPRTAAQRRYDALVSICLTAAGRGGNVAGTSPGGPGHGSSTGDPLVTIFTNPETLARAIETFLGNEPPPAAAPPPGAEPQSDLPLSETASGAPVDLRDLARAAIFGRFQHVLTDPTGLTINLGRRSRVFTGAARDAILLALGNVCIGCGTAHPAIQIDHLQPWAFGGATDQDNGAPLCPRCNRAKHEHAQTIVRSSTGWHRYRADGTEICPRPPPSPPPP